MICVTCCACCGCAQAFARDLERLYGGLSAIEPQVIVSAARQGRAQVSAQLAMDDSQMNRLLLQVPCYHLLRRLRCLGIGALCHACVYVHGGHACNKREAGHADCCC
jgi:hypothetical protein